MLRDLLPSGREFGSQERAISVSDSRPENESSRVGVSLRAIETTSKMPDSLLSDPTAVSTQQISTNRHLRTQCRDVNKLDSQETNEIY